MTSANEWTMPGLSEWLAVVRAYQTCHLAMSRKLAEVGLTVSQYDLLMSLLKRDGQTQQELANRLLVVKSNVSSLLSRVERDGWIERTTDPDDGRGKVVKLTRSGRRMARKGWQVQQVVVSSMLGALTQREMRQVARAMDRVREALLPLLDQGR
ncbi:MAG: MarR family winged helix-turn-helix transcriptional regulator [Proteobacteria bacterium]|nr:MarR family winged helix-turn-helix transcriptional regulator [Pseudomonadota bacterium]